MKTVHGVDRPVPVPHQDRDTSTDSNSEAGSWSYHWRGKGWLMIASSKWEVLGYGSVPADVGADRTNNEGHAIDWAVTYFAKTLFTPEGIDIYTRPGAKIPGALVEQIKKELKAVGDKSFQRLADDLFLVTHDDQ